MLKENSKQPVLSGVALHHPRLVGDKNRTKHGGAQGGKLGYGEICQDEAAERVWEEGGEDPDEALEEERERW